MKKHYHEDNHRSNHKYELVKMISGYKQAFEILKVKSPDLTEADYLEFTALPLARRRLANGRADHPQLALYQIEIGKYVKWMEARQKEIIADTDEREPTTLRDYFKAGCYDRFTQVVSATMKKKNLVFKDRKRRVSQWAVAFFEVVSSKPIEWLRDCNSSDVYPFCSMFLAEYEALPKTAPAFAHYLGKDKANRHVIKQNKDIIIEVIGGMQFR